MKIDDEDNDNHGRRRGLRNLLANDPLYRRVKDAMLLVMAIAGTLGLTGVDVKAFFAKDKPTVKVESREPREDRPHNDRYTELSNRITSLEVVVQVLQSTAGSTERKVDRLDDKMDRLLISRGLSTR